MSANELEINVEYNPDFSEAFETEKRYCILYGGAGSGKSYAAAQKILIRCVTEPGHRFLVLRKIHRTNRHSTFALFRTLIGDYKIPCIVHKSEMRIEFGNGSEILHAGVDDPEKLKSITGITGVWAEEPTELNLDDFTQVDLRLRGRTENYKQIILTFNPISDRSWLKQRFFDTEDDTVFIQKSTWQNNRLIDPEYVSVLHNVSDPVYRMVYLEGEWGRLTEGQIFTNYTTVSEIPDDLPMIYGVDFGYNNPSAIVEIHRGDSILYVRELLYKTHQLNADLIESFKTFYDFRKRHRVYCDAAEPDRITEFTRAGINARKANKDVTKGIDTLKEHQLAIVKGSHNLLSEIRSYVWDSDRDGNLIDRPLKKDDHAVDALRYAVHSAWHVEPRRPRYVL